MLEDHRECANASYAVLRRPAHSPPRSSTLSRPAPNSDRARRPRPDVNTYGYSTIYYRPLSMRASTLSIYPFRPCLSSHPAA